MGVGVGAEVSRDVIRGGRRRWRGRVEGNDDAD